MSKFQTILRTSPAYFPHQKPSFGVFHKKIRRFLAHLKIEFCFLLEVPCKIVRLSNIPGSKKKAPDLCQRLSCSGADGIRSPPMDFLKERASPRDHRAERNIKDEMDQVLLFVVSILYFICHPAFPPLPDLSS